LMEESYFNNFKDAANGSYYIQSIEAQLQDVAWKFFQRIETNGGITKSEQLLSDSIHLALDKRRDELKTGKRVVVGVNKYQNKNEPSAVLPAKDTLTGFLEKE
jgi:methylmalonyl-CoA mutase